jgi:catechol 2,3-dioxygenase-like lactoylglutathione lyase family enzyme
VVSDRLPVCVSSIDHLVLTVGDLERTVAFYTEVLGMKVVLFGEGRTALTFGQQKINLHQSGQEFEPKAHRPTPGSADLCLVTSVSPSQVLERLRAFGIEIIEGPAPRTGAVGPVISVYFKDPDLNLIEIASYA